MQLCQAVEVQFPSGVTLAPHRWKGFLSPVMVIGSSLRFTLGLLVGTRIRRSNRFITGRGIFPPYLLTIGIKRFKTMWPWLFWLETDLCNLNFFRGHITLLNASPESTPHALQIVLKVGMLYHVVWECPFILNFLEEVVVDINRIGGLTMAVDPRIIY